MENIRRAQQELVGAYLIMLRGVHPDDDKKVEWVELAVRIARMRYVSSHFHSAQKALSNALIYFTDNFSVGNYILLLDLYHLDQVLHRSSESKIDLKLSFLGLKKN